MTAQAFRLHRTTDPETSAAAARSIVADLPRIEAWALRCVQLTPGLTGRELADRWSPTDERRIGRRLAGLEERKLVTRGLPRRCAITGRSSSTWWPTA